MAANLLANVTISGNYYSFQNQNVSTTNVASGFSIGGPYITSAKISSSVATGQYHTAVILTDGTVRTFGYNGLGQLGVNDTTNRSTPVQVWGISSSATAVACGASYTTVLLANGTLRTFGRNFYGQLGVNDTTNRPTPVQVWGISSSAVAVACGNQHTAVLLADGTVRTFGLNNSGQLGVNDTTQRNTPVQVWGISSSAVAIAAGVAHTAVLLANGTVRTFGQNSYGLLGVNDTTDRSTPVQVWGISSSAVAVACGAYHTAVLLADGTVRTFGNNSQGQLGIGTTGGSRLTPVQVWGISSSATAIAGGQAETVFLLANGTVRICGVNTRGELGVNDTTLRNTPVQVWSISSSAVAIASGLANQAYLTAVVLADGTVRTFGGNTYGQLGVNDTTSRLTPVTVLNISTAVIPSVTGSSGLRIWTTPYNFASTTTASIAVGAYHTAVLITGGTVRTFGRNDQGRLGVNDTTDRSTPVQVWGISSSATAVECGYYHTAVLLADGTVRTFGRNVHGQLGINDTTDRSTPVTVLNITSATTVAGGGYHTVVLLADGTVRTFGRNAFGQLGVNDTTNRSTPVTVLNITSATAVAGGFYHTAVLLADGTVRTFGINSNGRLGVNDTTQRLTPVQVWGISSSATAVACGQFHTTVLLADGTVRTFGRNAFGQLGVNDTTQRLTPVQVWGISSSAIAISCGFTHTAVLLADGTVRTFGENSAGRLGINTFGGSRETPVQVWGISSSAVAIACGQEHTAVILADGTVQTVGGNTYGQLGVNDIIRRGTPVVALGMGVRYINAQGLSLGITAPTYQLDLSTDKARKLTTTTWLTGSDERIKTGIESANLARCVEIVDSLDLKYFKWNFPDAQEPPSDSHSLGWIAQDVKEIFPKSVRLTKDHGLDDFHNLDSDQLIKTMYGAIKKLCQDTYDPPINL